MVTCGLALWAVLALAPVVGACMDGICDVEAGVKAAHCGAPSTIMLCCDEERDQPIDMAAPGHQVGLATARHEPAPTPRERPSRVSVVALDVHGPPLYDLFASLLI